MTGGRRGWQEQERGRRRREEVGKAEGLVGRRRSKLAGVGTLARKPASSETEGWREEEGKRRQVSREEGEAQASRSGGTSRRCTDEMRRERSAPLKRRRRLLASGHDRGRRGLRELEVVGVQARELTAGRRRRL